MPRQTVPGAGDIVRSPGGQMIRPALLLLLLALAGCNTVQGVGKDVQKAGSAVEKAAK